MSEMLKLLAKQIGFLLIMAAMGIAALLAIMGGYLLAWQMSYRFLVIPLLINLALVFTALTAVMWFFRGFLFGRGRPWLAWFSMGCWVAVMGLVTVQAFTRGEPLFAPIFEVGNLALKDRIKAIEGQPFSETELTNLPSEDRYRVCESILLNENDYYKARRSGILVTVWVPESEEFTAKIAEGSACPEELKGRFTQLQQLRMQNQSSLAFGDTLKNRVVLAIAERLLMNHPDAIAQTFAIKRDFKDKRIERTIQYAKLHSRIYQNGQVNDHQWEELSGFDSQEYFNPQIWKVDAEDVSDDTWIYWAMTKDSVGSSEIQLLRVDCQKLDQVQYLLGIKTKDGKSLLSADPILFTVSRSDSLGYVRNAKACASKSQQVKLAPEVANAIAKP